MLSSVGLKFIICYKLQVDLLIFDVHCDLKSEKSAHIFQNGLSSVQDSHLLHGAFDSACSYLVYDVANFCDGRYF